MGRFFLALNLLLLWGTSVRASDRIEFAWPTPNPAWAQGKPARDYLQHAGSGDPESGGFGGVRSGGRQFHEGIDIRAAARDRHGEPTDAVFAAMTGVVRYVNRVAGNSSYGRYIVLEHTELRPSVYTLYAHLARIAPGIREGVRVERGRTIATMGHSSGGYMIPKARAHLHFEIGLAATRDFQRWYDTRKFGSRNQHGMWNGMNLLGIDPVDFLDRWRRRDVDNFQDYFATMETAVRLRIATWRTPDFVQRYPSLVTKPLPMLVGGWEIRFNWTGLPFSWTPLSPAETSGLAPDRPEVLAVNEKIERRERSRTLVVRRFGRWVVADDLKTVLQQIFALR
jgi:murein DD-endopeptidase MepM/ murein hydrolase activator NlpD